VLDELFCAIILLTSERLSSITLSPLLCYCIPLVSMRLEVQFHSSLRLELFFHYLKNIVATIDCWHVKFVVSCEFYCSTWLIPFHEYKSLILVGLLHRNIEVPISNLQCRNHGEEDCYKWHNIFMSQVKRAFVQNSFLLAFCNCSTCVKL